MPQGIGECNPVGAAPLSLPHRGSLGEGIQTYVEPRIFKFPNSLGAEICFVDEERSLKYPNIAWAQKNYLQTRCKRASKAQAYLHTSSCLRPKQRCMRRIFQAQAGVMELADVPDSKSGGSDTVRVRPPLPAPTKRPFVY